MLKMRCTPASLADRRGWPGGEPASLFESCQDHEERAELGAAWLDVCPEEALAFVVSSQQDRGATLAHVDRELDLAPLGHDALRIEARGRVGLEQVAALPESVLGHVRDLTVTQLRPDDGARFSETVTAARFPALTRLKVGGQAAVGEAVLGLIGEHLTDFTYAAKGLGASQVKKLAAYPLSRVTLYGLPEDAALPLLSLETLRSLRLNYCPFPHKHLKLLAKLPALRDLALVDHGLTKTTTKTLATLDNLQALDLSGNDRVDDGSWARLGALAQLERLTLNGNQVGAKTLAAVAPLPLVALHLDKTKIAALGGLPKMTALQTLSLVEAAPDAEGWSALGRLPQLRRLVLARVRARKEQLARLTELGSLRHLDLGGCGLKAEDLTPLTKLTSLRELNLEGNRGLADGGMTALTSLPLTGLDVSRCKLTTAGLESLTAIEPLEWLAIADNGISDGTPLGELQRLRWLHVGNNPIGTSAQAMGALSALVELYAQGCALEDGFGAVVAELPALRRLFVWENNLGDDAVAVMAPMKGLRLVNMVSNPLTDAGRRKLTLALSNCTFEW